MGMHRANKLVFAVAVLVTASFRLSAAGQPVQPKVTAVTVYSDRALITRTAEVGLSPGINTIELGGLPAAFIDRSLRVSGEAESDVKILDVRIKTVFIDTIPSGRAADLQSKLSALVDEEKSVSKRLEVLRSEMSFIDSLRIYYARSAQGGTTKNSYEDWGKMLSFLDKNMSAINDKTLDTDAKLREIRLRIGTIQSQIRQTQGYPRRSEKRVVVTLSAGKATTSELNLSYLLGGASWVPQYEVRATAGEKKIDLTYSAMVRQTTGEDWKDVALTLSTARPAEVGAPPELRPWEVGPPQTLSRAPYRGMQYEQSDRAAGGLPSIAAEIVREPGIGNTVRGRVVDRGTGEALVGANVTLAGTGYGSATDLNGDYVISQVPAGTYQARAMYVGYRPAMSSSFEVNSSSGVRADFMLGAASVRTSAVVVTAQASSLAKAETQALAMSTARVEEQISSATFVIEAPAKIPSDNDPHKVTIAMCTLPATLSYACVPKLSEDVYLTASVKDTTSYPFLKGEANVFLDNSFVATSPIETVFPDEDFDTYLGTDAAVKVERKLVKEFTESTGLLTKKTKITRRFSITVENNKSLPVSIEIKDQIPVSKDERVEVTQLAPNKAEFKPDDEGIITWNLNLKPHEKRELELAFAVEFPSDLQVSGIH